MNIICIVIGISTDAVQTVDVGTQYEPPDFTVSTPIKSIQQPDASYLTLSPIESKPSYGSGEDLNDTDYLPSELSVDEAQDSHQENFTEENRYL